MASTLALGFGQLRLRYRGGFDAERLLTPGEPVQVRIPITYVGHQVPAGSRLRLLISGSQFPSPTRIPTRVSRSPLPRSCGPVYKPSSMMHIDPHA